MTTEGSGPQTALHRPGAAPLRGTQSLVGVMSFVWKHPSLTALEVLWRWLVAAPLLYLLWRTLAPALGAVSLDTAALDEMTFFQPVLSAGILARQARLYAPAVVHTARWWVPFAVLLWSVGGTAGRYAVLRRAEPGVRPSPGQFFVVNVVRAGAFLVLLLLWARLLLGAVHVTVTHPGQRGDEPNIVLLAALAVAATLSVFLAWSVTIWRLDLVPLRAMTGMEVPAASRAPLRSKLMETNLVMGIVRVILFVLAMTFSASPLPFQSQQTQAFINVWWVGVALFYVLASDFFHVVRRVTYLRLLESIGGETNAPTRAAS